MKKIFLSLGFLALLLCGCTRELSTAVANNTIRNDIFTPAFQIVWNNFTNKIVGHKVEFCDGNPPILDVLNSNSFTVNDVSESAYFSAVEPNTFKTKDMIEKAIWDKFNEKSRILDQFQWVEKENGDYILYSMFKKDVNFIREFDILDNQPFDNSKENVKFFGIKGGAESYSGSVKPIFYNDENDFAVAFLTKENDKIILYATKDNGNVFDLFKNVINNRNQGLTLGESDTLKVPFISVDTIMEYPELHDKYIKNSDFRIGKTIDSVKFTLDNKGAKLVNEAGLLAKANSIVIADKTRNYDFNRPFVLYMIEDGKENPYFALRINDLKYLVK